MSHRREFMKFLAGSPLLFGMPGLARAVSQGATGVLPARTTGPAAPATALKA